MLIFESTNQISGHMVNNEDIRTMDDKIKAVKKFPTPT